MKFRRDVTCWTALFNAVLIFPKKTKRLVKIKFVFHSKGNMSKLQLLIALLVDNFFALIFKSTAATVLAVTTFLYLQNPPLHGDIDL